jgi:hypothetical protein
VTTHRDEEKGGSKLALVWEFFVAAVSGLAAWQLGQLTGFGSAGLLEGALLADLNKTLARGLLIIAGVDLMLGVFRVAGSNDDGHR